MRARAWLFAICEVIASVLHAARSGFAAAFQVSSRVARGADEADSSFLLFQRARRDGPVRRDETR